MILFISSFLICFAFPVIFKRPLSKSRLSTNKKSPMLLGISVYLSVFIVFICASIYYKTDMSFLINIAAGSAVILFIGILDDIKNLSVRAKLAGQISAACVVIFLGIRTSIVYFPPWINMLITLIWIVALVNGFNLLDIMDGLCTGISFIICVTFLAVSIISGMYPVAIFFWILSGAVLAAFIHNLPLARFYLGDSGSMLIGFIFACSTMQISYAPDIGHGLALFVPMLIVALPLYDLVFTVFMRRRKGIAIFKKSNDHFALLLRHKGLSAGKILVIMYAACAVSGISAFLLKALPLSLKPWVLTFFLFGVSAWTVFMVRILRQTGKDA
jgi:UDP-GlcNAc:undecaprenyl-phosphate/decaprenyl-phosphate GlcNAc-1-phosphate transferase